LTNYYNILERLTGRESVARKAHYVVEKRASGLIIRETTGDLLQDGTSPLLEAISLTFTPAARK
jgi:hypothetical protein